MGVTMDPTITVDETQVERARRAVSELNRMLPTLNAFARALADKKPDELRVVAGAASQTDGKTIWVSPPMELGDEPHHDYRKCDVRDERDLQTCAACLAREEVNVRLYHEVSHVIFETFEKMTPRRRQQLLDKAIATIGDTTDSESRAGKIAERINTYEPSSYMEAAVMVSPFLPNLLNALEDARINRAMHEARPGTKIMFDSTSRRVFEDGIEQPDGSVTRWRDLDTNSQALIAAYCKASEYDYTGWFAPEVETLMEDAELDQLLTGISATTGVGEIFNRAVPVLERLRALGYCKHESDLEDTPPEPEPEPEPEPQPEGGEDDQPNPRPGEPCPDGDPGGSEPTSDGDQDSGSESDDDAGNPGEGDSDDEPDSGTGPQVFDEDAERPTSGAGDDDSDDGDDEELESGDADDEGNSSEGDDAEQGDEGAPGDGDGEAGDGTEGDDGDDGTEGAGDADGSGDSTDDGADDGDNASDEGTPGDSGTSADGGTSESDDGDAASEAGEAGDDDEPANFADAAGEGSSSPAEGQGTPEQAAEDMNKFNGHDSMNGRGGVGDSDPVTGRTWDEDVAVAVSQADTFDAPSEIIHGVAMVGETVPENVLFDHDSAAARLPYMGYDTPRTDESVLSSAIPQLRIVFAENRKTSLDRDRKSGTRVDGRVLARRVPARDPRVFANRTQPGRKSYFVLIGLDVSGSTRGERLALIKAAAMAKAELLSRLGIEFAIYAHAGENVNNKAMGWRGEVGVVIGCVKGASDPWDERARDRLRALTSTGGNIDGHTIEQYRKMVEQSRATDKVILYYNDGEMPAFNYTEELEIIHREVRLCKQRGITLLGVGIQSNSPEAFMPSVRLDSPRDVRVVVDALKARLMDK